MRRQVTLASDDFEVEAISPSVWPSTAGATQTGGRLRIASDTPAPYNHASTGFLYPLEDHRFIVHVPTLPATHFSLQTILRLETVNGDVNKEWVDVAKTDKNLSFNQRINYTDDRTNTPYNAVAHAWWAIRVAEGVIYWETSPDGETWTVRREAPATADLETGARVRLMSGYFGTPGEGDITVPYAEFDDFKIIGPGPWMPRAQRAVSGGSKGGAVLMGKAKGKIRPVVTGGVLRTARYGIDSPPSNWTAPITKPDRIFITQWWHTAEIAAAKALGSEVLIYLNLTRVREPNPEGRINCAVTLKEAEELGAVSGEFDDDAGGWVVKPGTPGYPELWLQKAVARAVEVGANGVFLDDMNHHDNTGGELTDDQWRTQMELCNSIVGPGLERAGLMSITNMSGATGQRNLETAGWVARQFKFFRGGLDEFWLTWPAGAVQPYYFIEEAMRVLEEQTKAGKLYLATSNGDNTKLKLAIALLLLRMHEGAHWFGTANGSYGEQAWPPALEQALALGKPLGPATGTTRTFEHGSVTADPRAQTASIVLT